MPFTGPVFTTLARGEFDTAVVVIIALIWAARQVGKVLGGGNDKNKNTTDAPSATPSGGATKMSTQDRLRRLAEQRIRQMQEKQAGTRPPIPLNPGTARADVAPKPRPRPIATPVPAKQRVSADDLRRLEGQRNPAKAAAPHQVRRGPAPTAGPRPVTSADLLREVPKQQPAARPPTPAQPLGRSTGDAPAAKKRNTVQIGRLTTQHLRQAFILKELLDKPLALRNPTDSPWDA